MPYEVALEQFSGPMHLLLGLIEEEELEITNISLAQVTDDYLKHIEAHEPPPEELADFLIVATKLLLLKSKAIMPVPTMDEEDDPSMLAAQLRMYKEFVEASRHVEEAYLSGRMMFPQKKGAAPKEEAAFSPPPNATPSALAEAFQSLVKRLEPFFALKRASIERVVSVKERIGQIRDALLERSRMTFKDVVAGAESKVDVVVSFLAVLELMKQRVINVMQEDTFGDIEIKHVE